MIIFGIFVAIGVELLAFVALLFLVWHYRDHRASGILPIVIAVVTCAAAAAALILAPFDIFAATSTINEDGTKIEQGSIDAISSAMQVVYIIIYCLVIACAFIIAPFAFFYYEESGDDTSKSIGEKLLGSLKFTIFPIVVSIILFVLGMVLKSSYNVEKVAEAVLWIQELFRDVNTFENAILFMFGCLSVIGFLVFVVYTTFGMVSLPYNFFFGSTSEKQFQLLANEEVIQIEEEIYRIKERYANGSKRMSAADRRELRNLERKHDILTSTANLPDEVVSPRITAVCNFFKPAFKVFSVLLFLTSLFFVVCLLITQIDKVGNSFCGFSCGNLVAKPGTSNPIDYILTIAAKVFPLDYVLLCLLICFIFCCTISGIKYIGIRLVKFKFEIKTGRTPIPGILLMSLFLLLSISAFIMQINAVAPLYSSFGSQSFKDSEGKMQRCNFDDNAYTHCTLTQLSTYLTRLQVGFPFFGIVSYIGSWVVIAAFILSIFIMFFLHRRKQEYGDNSSQFY